MVAPQTKLLRGADLTISGLAHVSIDAKLFLLIPQCIIGHNICI
jgi:hypothetical protein